MATIKGIGLCLIPGENGVSCGRQVEDGEPIGTVLYHGPQVGHKKCADAFYARKQAEERRKREEMVKIGKQQGPGGAIGDPSTYPDALASGSFPLEKKEDEVLPVAATDNTPDGGADLLATVQRVEALAQKFEDAGTGPSGIVARAIAEEIRQALKGE